MMIFYVIIMLAGIATAIWFLVKQDTQEEKVIKDIKDKDKKSEEMYKKLREALRETEIKAEDLAQQLEAAQKAGETAQSECKSLKEECEDYKKNHELLRETFDKKQVEAAQITQEKSALQQRLREATDTGVRLSQELAALRTDLIKAQEEAKNFKESCHILEKALKQKEGVSEDNLPQPLQER